jgi:hypothetical protein
MGKMTFDASRCIDFLETLAFVDGARIGCIWRSRTVMRWGCSTRAASGCA